MAITAGSGTPIRVLTGLGAATADQQVMTLADSAGNLLGTTGAPLPTQQQGALPAGTNTIGGVAAAYTSVAAGSLGSLNATYEGTVDCALYSSVRLAITGTWAGTITFQVSNDQTNWVSRTLMYSTPTQVGSTTTTNGNYAGDIGARYFRATMTAYTSGTAVPQILYTSAPSAPLSMILSGGSNGIGSVAIGGTTQSTFATTSAASTNATNVKAGSGNLHEVTVTNPTATAAYFKLFNKASAPTVGTDLPIAIFRLAATGSAGDSLNLTFGPNGKRFTTGIAWAMTGAAAATDTTNAVAGVLVSGTYV